MNIQTYSSDKARELTDLFYKSVHSIDSTIYTDKQKEAWAPTPIDYNYWSKRLNIKKPFIAVIENRIVGFIELDNDGHIDCTYTHPNFQGKGVASCLFKYLIVQAKKKGIQYLYVEASLIAKSFFENRGFTLIEKNTIIRDGIPLINFKMEKYLTS